jgi:hypothetical protein
VKKSGHFLFSEVRQFLGSMRSTCISQFLAELTIAEEECIVSQKDNMNISFPDENTLHNFFGRGVPLYFLTHTSVLIWRMSDYYR